MAKEGNFLFVKKIRNVMRSYEIMYVIAGDITETKVKDIQKKVSDSITNKGGKVTKDDFWDKKPLSYTIKKQDSGYYSVLLIELSPEQLKPLDDEIKLIGEIIRYLIVKIEPTKIPKKVRAKKPVEKVTQKPAEAAKTEVKKPKTVEVKPVKKKKVQPKAQKPAEKPKLKKLEPKPKSVIEKEKKEMVAEKEREKVLDKKLEEILKEDE
jgi:small subunit ribosomal protein S6